MTFFTRRVGDAGVSGPRSDPVPPTDNQPLISCCRHLAHRLVPEHWDPTEVRATTTGTRLERDLVAVGQEFDRVLADPAIAAVIHSGTRPWPMVAPHLLELLLTAADSALTDDPSLTALIADTVLRARPGSRAAWRLRGLAHEQWGDLNAAIAAHQEYLALIDVDTLDVTTTVVILREEQDARSALASALLDAYDTSDVLPMPGAADLHDLLSRPGRREALEPALEDFLADLTRLPVADLASIRDLLHTVVHCLRSSQVQPPPLPATAVDSLVVFQLGDLRSWLTGRTICLVAEPDRLAASTAAARAAGTETRLGPRIDGYDLVARFAAGPLDPEDTGTRTDLMVIRHDQHTDWTQPTDLRLVLAESPSDWVHAVRQNLVAGAQRGLSDQALRHPARLNALIGPDPRPARPTNAFQLLRLLDHLDVNPTIDLIGFGPGDPFDGAEQDWLRPRGRRTDEQLVSLR